MAATVVAAIIVGWVAWPNGSTNSKSVDAGRTWGRAAAARLSVLPAVHLQLEYAPGSDEASQPTTTADVTVKSNGEAAGALTFPVAGKAEIAWSGRKGQLYVRGDPAFWESGPDSAELALSDRWISMQKRSGYYLLDSLPVDLGSLAPASIATLVRQVTTNPKATQDDTGTMNGNPVVSYDLNGWTVVLSNAAPHTVLAIGGTPSDTGAPIRSADWSPSKSHPAASPAIETTDFQVGSTVAAGDTYDPYLYLVPTPANDANTAMVNSTVSAATASPANGDITANSNPAADSPQFQVDESSSSYCSTSTCPESFSVTNTGGKAGDATLYVSGQGFGTQTFPLGVIAPGGTRTVNFTRPNQAPSGQTVNFTVSTWVYSPALYGPDPAVAQRLKARGIDPDLVGVGSTILPNALAILDMMTRGQPTAGQQAQEANNTAMDTVQKADSQQNLFLLSAIAQSGRLQNPQDLPNIVKDAAAPGNRRTMEQVANVLAINPNAKVTYDGPYVFNGKTYRADYIYTGTANGQPFRRAVQVKTITSAKIKSLSTNLAKAARQLNGLGKGPYGTSDGENAPPGFERVALIYANPQAMDLFGKTTEDLQAFLSSGARRQAMANLCNGNKLLVDRLIIVNNTGQHEWTDLSELNVPCAKKI